MNYLFVVLIFMPIVLHVKGGELFDRHSGKKIHEQDCARQCAIEVKPCTPHEGSRVDGTCNNYKHPASGSARGPYMRLLKPDYGHMGGLRENRHGEPLPSARRVRTALQSTGRVVDKHTFNVAAAAFLELINVDVSLVTGPLDYLRKRTYCCQPEGAKDPRCQPIPVPHDDPYLRMTGIHCMNYSRIETFHDLGCTAKDTIPDQAIMYLSAELANLDRGTRMCCHAMPSFNKTSGILHLDKMYPDQNQNKSYEKVNHQTPLLDLSTIYGVDEEKLKGIRMYEHGLLREEKRKDRHVPLNETGDVCFQNRGPNPVCYKFGYPEAGNFDVPTTLMTIYFYREHNRIARELHELNPCWKDDRLFKVARQINIATAANIFFYELLPVIMGHKNLLNHGLISDHVEYVTAYDEGVYPLVYAEYELAKRFFETFWDGRIKKYDERYRYVGEFSLGDTYFRQELIEEHSNFEELNRGLFYQHAAKIDDIQDPDMSEKAYAKLLQAHDRPAIAIQRGRDFGLPGYNSYRKPCGLKPAKHFHDLLDVMSTEKMEALMNLYQDVEDIDLMAGIMVEELLPGTFVGPTLYCIMAKQFYVFRFSDRFWFERGKQYHSFTMPQLHEIRKTNMARLACDNAEGIKSIQPRALLNVEHGNEHLQCSRIRGADLSKWYDDTCHRNQDYNQHGYKQHNNYHFNFYGHKASQ